MSPEQRRPKPEVVVAREAPPVTLDPDEVIDMEEVPRGYFDIPELMDEEEEGSREPVVGVDPKEAFSVAQVLGRPEGGFKGEDRGGGAGGAGKPKRKGKGTRDDD